MRWGNFKEASAWSEVHGHATRHTKSTVTTCLFSFLLISLSDFFYACSIEHFVRSWSTPTDMSVLSAADNFPHRRQPQTAVSSKS